MLAGSAFSSEPVFGSATDSGFFGKGRDAGNWKKSNCGVSDRSISPSSSAAVNSPSWALLAEDSPNSSSSRISGFPE